MSIKLGYAVIGTNDLAASRRFYDELLGEVGFLRLPHGPEGAIWGTRMSQPWLGVKRPVDGARATVGNGSMVALALPDKRSVDELYEKALKLGAKDEGRPGPRGDQSLGGYFAYFRDLDGNKLAIYHMP